MRVRNEPIAVRLSSDAVPAQFVWRRRLWRVLAVQRSWVEAEPWWDDPRVRRARGQDAPARWSNELGGPSPPPEARSPGGDLLGDRTIWRVEASAGASAQAGVYELACRGSEWLLRAIVD